MALFRFTATNTEGKQYEGSREAADRFVLYRDLKKEGSVILSVYEENGHHGGHINLKAIPLPFGLGGVKAHDKIVFARNLAAMLEAGMALSRVLTVLERQTE